MRRQCTGSHGGAVAEVSLLHMRDSEREEQRLFNFISFVKMTTATAKQGSLPSLLGVSTERIIIIIIIIIIITIVSSCSHNPIKFGSYCSLRKAGINY